VILVTNIFIAVLLAFLIRYSLLAATTHRVVQEEELEEQQWLSGEGSGLLPLRGVHVLIIIIIIRTFLSRHKVVTSEAVAAQVRSCHYCLLL